VRTNSMNISGSYDDWPFMAEFYDSVVPYAERADIRFYVELARASTGAVLEIGCGTGRILIPAAKAGVRITGLDASASMLAVCRNKLAAEPEEVQERVTLIRADMRRFQLHRRFELVTLPFRPFQHLLTVADELDCLECIRAQLTPGGKLVMDIFNPSLQILAGPMNQELIADEPEFSLPDGRRVRRHACVTRRDIAQQVQDVELAYDVTHPDGRTERFVHRFPMRYLFRFELEHLLARAGFDVEEVYCDYDKSPFGTKDVGEIIAVARRL
jgi:SAM-dependent methyltransferase